MMKLKTIPFVIRNFKLKWRLFGNVIPLVKVTAAELSQKLLCIGGKN